MGRKKQYEHLTEAWVVLYVNEGMTLREIAEIYSVSHRVVQTYLNDFGVSTKYGFISQDMVDEWVYLYTVTGIKTSEIARMSNVSARAVLTHLKKSGIDTSHTYIKTTPKMIDEWVRLYNEKGMSTKHIATIYDTRYETVCRNIKKAGVDTSFYTYLFGRVYIIFYKDVPIYVGQTQFHIEKRLSRHVSQSANRSGSLARFIDDNNLTVDDLDIHLLEDDIPVECLAEVEKMYIHKWSSSNEIVLLNNNHNPRS